MKYLALLLAACGLALAQGPPADQPIPPIPNTNTATAPLFAAQATARPASPTSNVKGKVFDRVLIVYLETTDYGNATADPNCAALASQGIALKNLYGVGAPSQPAYVAAASGDTFGLNSDSFVLVNENVSTIIDLLEDKGISWGNYNEGMPYTGFEGFIWNSGLYERKHNLLARFDSVRLNSDRLAQMKNLTYFYVDLLNEELPQWIFVTPNLWNDGHNSDHRTSCAWTRGFVESLLQNEYFNTNTLVYVTWQANGDAGGLANHLLGILVGSAVPSNLVGTTDDNYYNHYSELASIQANWDLHNLGRWDVGANVWDFVGQKTGDEIRTWSDSIAGAPFSAYLWNQSYGGVFSNANDTGHTYVAPNVDLTRGGRTILPSIAKEWADSILPDYYLDQIEIPDAFHPPPGFGLGDPLTVTQPFPIPTAITAYPYANPPPTPTGDFCLI